eukprot:586297-Pelagomonas_calceolata.AAC.4
MDYHVIGQQFKTCCGRNSWVNKQKNVLQVKAVYRDVSREVNNAVRDLRMDILEIRRRQAESVDRLLPELEQQVTSMERQLTPALERYYAQTQRQAERESPDRELQLCMKGKFEESSRRGGIQHVE